MKRLLAVLVPVLLLNCQVVRAQDKPPAGYENWGVCPFECCTYREWTAGADVPVYQGRSERSPVAFQLRRDERVQALTGVVVTEKAGVLRVDKPMRDGYVDGTDQPQLSLKAGDIVYQLAPLGEGSYLFWFKGKVYSSGIDMAALPLVDGGEARMVWWKLIRNKAGKMGWSRSDRFLNVDACG